MSNNSSFQKEGGEDSDQVEEEMDEDYQMSEEYHESIDENQDEIEEDMEGDNDVQEESNKPVQM